MKKMNGEVVALVNRGHALMTFVVSFLMCTWLVFPSYAYAAEANPSSGASSTMWAQADGGAASGSTGTGGTTGGSTGGTTGGSTGGTTGGSGSDTPTPPAQASVYSVDITACSTDATGGWVTRLPRTSLGADAYELTGGLGTKGGRLRMLACVSWDNGCSYYQSDADWKDVSLSWTSSNSAVATVDSCGIVTAVSNGTAVITCTTPNGTSGTMSIEVFGQAGAYVFSAVATDASGAPLDSGYQPFNDMSETRQFYVRLTYSDQTTECNAPGASDYAASFSNATCQWSSQNTDVGYVNPTSGMFKPKADGHTKVVLTATGGDPTYNGGIVTAEVLINVDTGNYGDGNAPSSSLHIQVVYEKQPDLVGKDVTLSIDELKALQNVQCVYTLTKSAGDYVTDSAEGIYLSTLLDHLGMSVDDVAYFKFSANDGANPGNITKSFLFDYARYYYPLANWSSTNKQVAVAPMLAYADSWHEGGSCAADYSTLNYGTCFRLVFGSTGLKDGQTSRSLKFINSMTVVLAGAPPTGWGTADNTGSGGKDSGGDGFGVGSTGAGLGGSGVSGGTSAGGSGSGATGVMAGDQTAGDDSGSSGASSEGKAFSDGSSTAGSSGRWQVFEMMNKQDSDVDAMDWTNPLEPYVVPLLGSVAAAGACATGLRFRRRLAMP